MLSSLLSFVVVALSLLVSSDAQSFTSTWGICFQSSSLANSPYGPWSVAMYGTLTAAAPAFFNVSGTPSAAGGVRYGQMLTAASLTRVQLNRDGTTSTAALTLASVGVQGSDMVFYNSTPYTDWNGMAFAVATSTNTPFTASGSGSWVVYPNDFAVQAVELYYDLPTYNYPTEYHCDNQTNAVMTIQPNTAPTCNPAALPSTLQSAALTYQFCYQAYAAASGSQPAWQVAIQGTFLTKTGYTTSTISGQCGLYILAVSGTRTQSASGSTTTAAIVGQGWHNSGGGDGNEFSDDPLLMINSPYLVSGRGFVLATSSKFLYPNGTGENVDYGYSLVDADPLMVSGSSIIESQGPKPDWSGFAVSCSCSPITCPLITSSSSAASGGSSASSSCSAVSSSFSASTTQCSTSSSLPVSSAATCTPPSSGGAAHITLSAFTLVVALTVSVALLL